MQVFPFDGEIAMNFS